MMEAEVDDDPRMTRMEFYWRCSDDLPEGRNVSVSVGPDYWRIETVNKGLDGVFCLTHEAMLSVVTQVLELLPKRHEKPDAGPEATDD